MPTRPNDAWIEAPLPPRAGPEASPGRILLDASTPAGVRAELAGMGYELTLEERTSGPIAAIMLDAGHGTMWGAASDHGDAYGIGWQPGPARRRGSSHQSGGGRSGGG